MLPKDNPKYPPQPHRYNGTTLEVNFNEDQLSIEQLTIIGRKMSGLWHNKQHKHFTYIDFRDLWIEQNGLCLKCGKELDFWNMGAHNYRLLYDTIYCYSCANAIIKSSLGL